MQTTLAQPLELVRPERQTHAVKRFYVRHENIPLTARLERFSMSVNCGSVRC